MIFSIFSKTNPFCSIIVLSIAIVIMIFFGISKKRWIKKFTIILAAASLLAALLANIYNFAALGNFSSHLVSFEILQVIEITIILFGALNILFFVSANNIENEHFIKILILLLLSVCCIIFIIISRNFLLVFLSLCAFLISIFQLVTSLNTRWGTGAKHILRFFMSSSLAVTMIFFGFSVIYGSTDFKNFRQIVESETLLNPITVAGIIILGVAIYLYLFLFPFQGPYLKLMRRCEYSSMPVVWFLYFPAGIFLLGKLNEVIFYIKENCNIYIAAVFVALSFVCMVSGNIGAVRTTSTRRIFSFIFLSFNGIYLLNYGALSAGFVNIETVQWLNIVNLSVLAVSFFPAYSIAVNIEKGKGSDSESGIRGFLRSNTYLSINLIIILLSWFYYIELLAIYFREWNLLEMDISNLAVLILAGISFIFLAVNIFRLIIIQFLKSSKENGRGDADDGTNSIVFHKFHYIYISFFTVIVLMMLAAAILRILNVEIYIFSFEITGNKFLEYLMTK